MLKRFLMEEEEGREVRSMYTCEWCCEKISSHGISYVSEAFHFLHKNLSSHVYVPFHQHYVSKFFWVANVGSIYFDSLHLFPTTSVQD